MLGATPMFGSFCFSKRPWAHGLFQLPRGSLSISRQVPGAPGWVIGGSLDSEPQDHRFRILPLITAQLLFYLFFNILFIVDSIIGVSHFHPLSPPLPRP